MDAIVNSIVAELDGHIQTLQAAKAAILGSTNGHKPVRSSVHTVQSVKEPKRRKMSAAARKRIGDATKKRWAAKKKADKAATRL